MHNKPIALVILDGFGISKHTQGNAIAQADIPCIRTWMNTMPYTELHASGHMVGLPDNYVGNSEVGHITIGAGRIIEQAITIINHAIHDGSFFINPILVDALKKAAKDQKKVHVIGILSDAGIHGNQDHIIAYAQAAYQEGIRTIYIHAILDGRDTQPHTAWDRIMQLQKQIAPYHAHLASIHGRFYAMDRNKNYERTRKSYRILTDPHEKVSDHVKDHIINATPSEEYCEPIRIDEHGIIADGDYVIFTTCRADRIRQLVRALQGDQTVIGAMASIKHLTLISPIPYGTSIHTQSLFIPKSIHNTLKEILCLHERTVFSIAETEKYAHITYFFNGEKENVLSCEIRHLIPSKRVKNYIHNPEMSAPEITDTVIRSLQKDPKDFYLINYANADMVGHSGNLQATIKAIEFLDQELERLYQVLVEELDGTLFIVGDHGNAEEKINPETGTPSPTHTRNPVPFIVITQKALPKNLVQHMHGLADVAPCILKYMKILVPPEMTDNTQN